MAMPEDMTPERIRDKAAEELLAMRRQDARRGYALPPRAPTDPVEVCNTHAADRDAHGWRDISTAPKDGTRVLAFLPEMVIRSANKRHADGTPFTKHKEAACMIVRWIDGLPGSEYRPAGLRAKGLLARGGYWTARADGLRPTDRRPSHWRPLPPAPEVAPDAPALLRR